jgi:aldose 1-epimerase
LLIPLNRYLLDLSITNHSSKPMPFGLGHHLYFTRTPKTILKANVSGYWEMDENVLPTRHVAIPPDRDLRTGFEPSKVFMDNTYSDWQGPAFIEWPESKARLTMTADERMEFLLVYSPPGKDEGFVCFEPVSNRTDAFNDAAKGVANTGTRILSPQTTETMRVSLSPEIML